MIKGHMRDTFEIKYVHKLYMLAANPMTCFFYLSFYPAEYLFMSYSELLHPHPRFKPYVQASTGSVLSQQSSVFKGDSHASTAVSVIHRS